MLESLVWLPGSVATVAVTYFIHSTILLATAWLVIRFTRTQSYALVEQLWKSAAIAGLITASLHLSLGIASPVFQFKLATESEDRDATLPVEKRRDSRPSETSIVSEASIEPSTAVTIEVPVEDSVLVMADRDFQLVARDPPASSFDRAAQNAPEIPVDSARTLESEIPLVATIRNAEVHASRPKLRLEPTYIAPAEIEPKPDIFESSFLTFESLNRETLAIAIIIAVALIAFLVARFFLQIFAFRRRVARLSPLKCQLTRELLDQLLSQSRVRRRVEIYSSQTYSEPVAFGVFRWRIVLPVGLDRVLPRDEMRALLAHELAHLVRGDTAWIWIGHILCSMFAFQPLNFLARKRWRWAAEFQCDDWAVRRDVAPLVLARCLTRVAERRQRQFACASSLAAIGAKSTLSHRVERLVEKADRNDPWQRTARRRAIDAVILAIVSVLAVWGPSAVLPARSAAPKIEAGSREREFEPVAAEAFSPAPSTVANSPVDDLKPAPIVASTGNSVDDELVHLQTEMNQLVAETQSLATDVQIHPELRSISDRLVTRIDQLQRRIDQLRNNRQTPQRVSDSQ